MVGHSYLYKLIKCLLKPASLLIKIYPLVGVLGLLASLLLVKLVPRMIPPAQALCEIPPLRLGSSSRFALVESRWSSLVVALEFMAILSSHVVYTPGRIFLGYALPWLVCSSADVASPYLHD